MLNSCLKSFHRASKRLKFQAGLDCSSRPDDMASVRILLFSATWVEEEREDRMEEEYYKYFLSSMIRLQKR